MTNDTGPLETAPFPEHLTARAVDSRTSPRLHGFDVEGDLAVNYSFAEMVVIALTGTPPDRVQGQAAEVAFAFWLPAFAADAPAHAAGLAGLCGTSTSGLVACGATALAEQSRWVVAAHQGLLAYLEQGSPVLPPEFTSAGADDDMAVQRMRSAVEAEVPFLAQRPTRTAAVLGLLHFAGLRGAEQLEASLTIARLPGVLAEALLVPHGRIREYPMNLPPFDYRGQR